MWKAGSAGAGFIASRVLGEGTQHFLKGNDFHKQMEGWEKGFLSPFHPVNSALPSGVQTLQPLVNAFLL